MATDMTMLDKQAATHYRNKVDLMAKERTAIFEALWSLLDTVILLKLTAAERDVIMFDVLVALLRADKLSGNGISASGIECLLAHAAQEASDAG